MTLDPELSRQLMTYLSDRDNPASIFKAIDLILSVCPERDTEDLILYILCVDDGGQAVSDMETCLPTMIIKSDWLVI